MKRIFTCLLIIVISFVNSYETIKHFSKSFADSAFIDRFQCEEESDSKESKESQDEKNFSDDFYLDNHKVSYYLIGFNQLSSNHNNHFLTSDYYEEVFFPPELS